MSAMLTRYSLLFTAFAVMFSPASLADELNTRSRPLARVYAPACMQYAGKPQELRKVLAARQLQALPDEAAKPFLDDVRGDAWLAPDKSGDVVITLKGDIVCTVAARRVGTKEHAKRMSALATTTPPPLVAAQLKAELSSLATGPRRTIYYSWSNQE